MIESGCNRTAIYRYGSCTERRDARTLLLLLLLPGGARVVSEHARRRRGKLAEARRPRLRRTRRRAERRRRRRVGRPRRALAAVLHERVPPASADRRTHARARAQRRHPQGLRLLRLSLIH